MRSLVWPWLAIAALAAFVWAQEGLLFYGDMQYREWEEAVKLGYSVKNVSDAEWRSFTVEDFAKYKAIIIPDPDCKSLPEVDNLRFLEETKSKWSSAVTGPVILIGTDPSFHALDYDGAVSLIRGGLNFAASGNETGLYFSLSCYYQNVEQEKVAVLSEFGDFEVRGQLSCYNDAHLVANSTALLGINDTALSDWSCSVHEVFSDYPKSGMGGFEPLVIAQGYNATGVRTFADNSSGIPYILSRYATPTGCGNGIWEARFGEECDNGASNGLDNSTCSQSCKCLYGALGNGTCSSVSNSTSSSSSSGFSSTLFTNSSSTAVATTSSSATTMNEPSISVTVVTVVVTSTVSVNPSSSSTTTLTTVSTSTILPVISRSSVASSGTTAAPGLSVTQIVITSVISINPGSSSTTTITTVIPISDSASSPASASQTSVAEVSTVTSVVTSLVSVNPSSSSEITYTTVYVTTGFAESVTSQSAVPTSTTNGPSISTVTSVVTSTITMNPSSLSTSIFTTVFPTTILPSITSGGQPSSASEVFGSSSRQFTTITSVITTLVTVNPNSIFTSYFTTFITVPVGQIATTAPFPNSTAIQTGSATSTSIFNVTSSSILVTVIPTTSVSSVSLSSIIVTVIPTSLSSTLVSIIPTTAVGNVSLSSTLVTVLPVTSTASGQDSSSSPVETSSMQLVTETVSSTVTLPQPSGSQVISSSGASSSGLVTETVSSTVTLIRPSGSQTTPDTGATSSDLVTATVSSTITLTRSPGTQKPSSDANESASSSNEAITQTVPSTLTVIGTTSTDAQQPTSAVASDSSLSIQTSTGAVVTSLTSTDVVITLVTTALTDAQSATSTGAETITTTAVLTKTPCHGGGGYSSVSAGVPTSLTDAQSTSLTDAQSTSLTDAQSTSNSWLTSTTMEIETTEGALPTTVESVSASNGLSTSITAPWSTITRPPFTVAPYEPPCASWLSYETVVYVVLTTTCPEGSLVTTTLTDQYSTVATSICATQSAKEPCYGCIVRAPDAGEVVSITVTSTESTVIGPGESPQTLIASPCSTCIGTTSSTAVLGDGVTFVAPTGSSGPGLAFLDGPSDSVLPRKEKYEAGGGSVVTAGAGRLDSGLPGRVWWYVMVCLAGLVMVLAM